MDAHPEQPAESLRAELKAWEKAFSEKHEGRKATRDEIKQHGEIGTCVHLEQSYPPTYVLLQRKSTSSTTSYAAASPMLLLQVLPPLLRQRGANRLRPLKSPCPHRNSTPPSSTPTTLLASHPRSISRLRTVIGNASGRHHRRMEWQLASSTFSPRNPRQRKLVRRRKGLQGFVCWNKK